MVPIIIEGLPDGVELYGDMLRIDAMHSNYAQNLIDMRQRYPDKKVFLRTTGSIANGNYAVTIVNF